MKFKVGDRVKTRRSAWTWPNREGVVEMCYDYSMYVQVGLDNLGSVSYTESELELAHNPYKAPTKADRLYMGHAQIHGMGELEPLVAAQVTSKPCSCPLHGPTGLLAQGCTCGGL